MKRYGGKENYYEEGCSMGRPRKLTSRDVRNACRHLSNQTAHNASDLQHEYFLEVSVDTVKRALRQEGLEPHIRRRVPFISRKNLRMRKSWAEERLEWTVNNWEAVDFSDESIFRLFGSDGMEWCWRKPEQRLDPQFMKKKVKHSNGKVVVWGMITPYGVGHIVQIEGNLNKELYCEILQDDLLGTYQDLRLDYHDRYFQQDNDPKHTSKLAQAWFQSSLALPHTDISKHT